jgi:hypothetical protein
MSVAGCTMVRMGRQSISHDRPTSAIRVASSARRGFTWRSTYNANCFLRNRFSAASWARDRTAVDANRATSPMTRSAVRTAASNLDRLIAVAIVPDQPGWTRGAPGTPSIIAASRSGRKSRRRIFLRSTGFGAEIPALGGLHASADRSPPTAVFGPGKEKTGRKTHHWPFWRPSQNCAPF